MLRGKNQIRIGAFYDLPPDEFSSQISDEKKRKALFVQQCRETKTKTKGWDVSEDSVEKDVCKYNEKE